MGLNIGTITSNNIKPIIDTQALVKVSEQILNPEKNVDVSKLDLSKFNRAKIGTDLYSPRTNSELALKTAKAVTDFDVNLSKSFSANVQYLNSQAAQSLFTSKENNGKLVLNSEISNTPNENKIVQETSQVSETQNMNKDKRGSNPFSFYVASDSHSDEKNEDAKTNSINIFA